MGQALSNSPTSSAEGDLSQVHSKLAAQFNFIKSITTLNHKELGQCIEELNSVTCSFTDRAGKQLRFLIKKGTDTTFLWKSTIRIRCLKINTSTNIIESSRLLNLRQFVVIYKEITEQVAALSASPPTSEDAPSSSSCQEELTASAFFPPQEKLREGQDDPVNECCVCMDRKACVMLSCCHEFCEVCIDNWTRDERHSNCPLCRKQIAGSDDTWVLTDKTETGDYESEVKGYLVGLADRSTSDM